MSTSSLAHLPLMQQYLTRYGMSTYIIFGNIGLLLNIVIFFGPAHHRNPCSIYILAASLCGLIGLNVSTIPVVYALDHPNPATISVLFCQLQFYFRHSFNQMMRTLFIFACIDRYAISSAHVRIRSFSRYRTAIYTIICVPIFWFLLAIFPFMFNSLENGRCGGKKGISSIILSVYITIFVGVIPLLSMMTFGILMLKNLKNIHARVQPSTVVHRVHKRDRDMTKMLLIETTCYIMTTAPLSINLLYQAATQTIIKSSDRQLIETFITYFNGTFLIYFNNSVSFWIYICVSRSFRLEVKHLYIKCYEVITVTTADQTALPLCQYDDDKPYVKETGITTIISTQYYPEQNRTTYYRTNASLVTDNSQFLCVLLTIFVFFLYAIGVVLWILQCTDVKEHRHDIKYTTSQPVHNTTASEINDQSIVVTDLHWTTEIKAEELVKKVLFIVADGIPADVIENASVTNMRQIQSIGAYTRAYVGGDKGTYTETATISSPGYMSLLTGTWGNKHNVYNNYVTNPNYHYKNIFRLVKELQPDKKIGIFSTWTTNRVKLIGEGLSEAGNITFDYKFDGYEFDRITYPHDKKSLYVHKIDERVTNETSDCIRTDAPDLSWVYLQNTDDIGHFFGDSKEFSQSIAYLDDQIGRIWNAIDYRIKYHKENWLVIITTDHGRDSKNGKHHAGQSVRERTTWIVTNSQETNTYFRDFQCGIVDILPTIARFMNFTIPIDSERELDGIPLIGNVSLIKPDINLNDDKLKISWTVIDNTGNVTVWLSTSNLFKKGERDNYKLIEIVSINTKMIIIDITKYPSQFYKIVLEGQYNTVNKWVYKQWRQKKTYGTISSPSYIQKTTQKNLLNRITQKSS